MKVLPYTCKRADPKSSHPGTPGTGTAYCKPPALPPLYTYPSTTSSFLSANLPQKANHHPPPNFPLEMHPISSTNCTNFQWKFTPISSANSSNFQCKFQRKGHGKAAQCQNLPHFPATTNIPLNTNKSQNLYNNCKNTIQSCHLMEFTLQY